MLDHVLVSANLYPRVRAFQYAHANAYMPEALRGEVARPERLSDHEMPVVFLRFRASEAPVAPVAVSPGTPVPAPPALIQDTTPTLVWSESLRAVSYNVVLVNGAGKTVFARNVPASACSRGFCEVTTGVLKLGTYKLKVRARNGLGASLFSGVRRFKIVP